MRILTTSFLVFLFAGCASGPERSEAITAFHDTDLDGLPDAAFGFESFKGPVSVDTDGDGLPDTLAIEPPQDPKVAELLAAKVGICEELVGIAERQAETMQTLFVAGRAQEGDLMAARSAILQAKLALIDAQLEAASAAGSKAR